MILKIQSGDGYKDDIFEFVDVKFYRVRETYVERINSKFIKIKEA
jgi:hypothetical protein